MKKVVIGMILVVTIAVGIVAINSRNKELSQRNDRGDKNEEYDSSSLSVKNTPYRSKEEDEMTEEEREESAEKDTSRMVGSTMHVAIKEYGDTEQFGYADIIDVNGKAQISIHTEISEPPLEVKQPAILYHGTCKNKGSQAYELTPLLDGKSDTTMSISLKTLQSQLPLALFIHRGDGDLRGINSCGDL